MENDDRGTALITGGASGIGFAVATVLGLAGYTVAILGSTAESGQRAARNPRFWCVRPES